MSFAHTSIGFWLPRRAELTPDRVAMVIDERRITYAELDADAARCANVLASQGVGPGDRVGTLLDNGVPYVEVFFACARLGAIVLPLSPRLAAAELEFMVEDAGCSVLVYDAAFADLVKAFRPGSSIRRALAVGDVDDPSYDEALAAAEAVRAPEVVAPDDVLAIFYTSGTTGRPKGAMLTHANVASTNLNMIISAGFAPEERTLMVLPMFHVGGWNVNTLAVWLLGGTVYVERSFDPARALSLIQTEGLTGMMGVPTIYQMIADHPDFASTDLSSLRACICGGAPLPVALIRRYQERGVRFVQGYGLTEAAPNCLILPAEDAERKAGAAGRPYFFVDVRVVDDHDEPVAPGASGEIIVRGPSVMKGYWRRPEETAAALRGGWLRTGDVGRIDDEGYITIVDRLKDMYISGGENVYPAEVEKVLHAHPAIAEAAVIGVTDERWGEVGRAIVVARPGASVTEDEVRAFCAEHLAKFKVPASVVLADALPRNATGKLLKADLRARFGADA